MADDLKITEQSISGLLSAIETLQEVLIVAGLTSAERLAASYDAQAQRYFEANFAEATHVLEQLVMGLRDPTRKGRRTLLHDKPKGQA